MSEFFKLSFEALTPAKANEGQPQAEASGPMELAVVVKPMPKATTPIGSLADLSDRLKKLVYLFDCSGSMKEHLVGISSLDQFLWSNELMAKIKTNVQVAVKKAAAAQVAMEQCFETLDPAAADEEPVEMPDIPTVEEIDMVWASLDGLEGSDLQMKFLQKGLQQVEYIPTNWQALASEEHTRLGAVKKMANEMIDIRGKKYPDADVAAFGFNSQLIPLEAVSLEDLKAKIQTLAPCGGTYILGAVEGALSLIEKHPSKMNVNHVVLVTDAEDYSGQQLPSLLPKMKVHGVTLDFIFVSNPQLRKDEEESSSVSAIKQVCQETGGEYVHVTTEEEFKSKFIAASTRLCLPPASY